MTDADDDIDRYQKLLRVMTFPPGWDVSIDKVLTFAGPVGELRIEATRDGDDTVRYVAYSVLPSQTGDEVLLRIIQSKAHEVAAAMVDRQITVDGAPLSRVQPRVQGW